MNCGGEGKERLCPWCGKVLRQFNGQSVTYFCNGAHQRAAERTVVALFIRDVRKGETGRVTLRKIKQALRHEARSRDKI